MLPRPLIPAVLTQLDDARRRTGRLFDTLGAGPHPNRSRVLLEAPAMRLHAYDTEGAGPAVLLVPAPIKRWYIWDLDPRVSVVNRCREHGLRVFLVEWTDPGPAEQGFGLEQYAGNMLRTCVRAIGEETGRPRVALVGHSLGGTLAAIFAARHPELVTGLTLLESPLHFGADAGAFAPVVAMAPHAAWLTTREQGMPGSFLDLVTAVAAPVTFHVSRYADLVLSLGNSAALATHLRVQRWTLDELPLPAQLFEEVVERLYRRDELMAGTLRLAGRRVGPQSLTVPMLNVVNPHSRVIPPESVLPFHDAAASAQKRVLHYHGDVGVAIQHVGALVGGGAHRTLWPALLQWIVETSDPPPDDAR